MKQLLLDANVLVRFLVQDEPKHGAAATALFHQAEKGELRLILDGLALSETVYVLTGVYRRGRVEVANVLLAVIQNAGVETTEGPVLTETLQRFGAHNVDFADAWLAARAARMNCPVASFDRDLDKFKDITRFEPKA